jgi:aminopeptidase N
MKRIFLFFIAIICFYNSQAQLLSGKKEYTRKDSLRGTLFEERSCFDARKYTLTLNVDIAKKHLSGSVLMKLKAVSDFKKIQLDLYKEMGVDKVMWGNVQLIHERFDNHFYVLFPTKIEKGKEIEIEVFYSGSPIAAKNAPWDGGFVWTKDKKDFDWVGVACEGDGASLWWPCKDHWSDEPEEGAIMNFSVPKGYTAVSNGILTKTDTSLADKSTFQWSVKSPINIYNINLSVGKYVRFNELYPSKETQLPLLLDYWVLDYNLEKAKKQFSVVPEMMACFESKFGRYPFYEDGYKLVETPYLGMEHQSAIAYGNKYQKGYFGNTKFTGGYEFDYIIIHESGHEWFGNNITAADPADMWIHEAFTTYSESVYVECLYGKEKAVQYINNNRARIQNKEAIQGDYGVAKEGDGEMYQKGSLFINTLRHVIDNEAIWGTILKDMNEAFRHKTVHYRDIVAFFSKKAGTNLEPLFHQYVQKAPIPELKIQEKKSKNGKVLLTLSWDKTNKKFEMPIYILDGDKQQKFVVKTNKKSQIEVSENYKVNQDFGFFSIKK